MEALDPLGTVLKNALWDPEHHLLEVDEAILFHLSRRMPQSTNDARVSDGKPPFCYVFAMITFHRDRDHRATAEEEIHGKQLSFR